jgi:NADH-quinone oxidoreductase subunit J
MTEVNTVFFYLVALGILSTAIYAVASPKLLNAALSLALSFFAIGGLYFMLGNGFLGVLQILINAGAIPIVTVFIIFMTQSRRVRLRSNLNAAAAGLALIVVAGSLWSFWDRFQAANQTRQVTAVPTATLGERLLSPDGMLLAFEIASVLLLLAMVGAIVLTKRDGETIKGDVGVLSEVGAPVTAGALERPAATIEQASRHDGALVARQEVAQ